MREQDGAESLGSVLGQGYLGLVCLVVSSMEEDEPMQIRSGSNHVPKASAMCTKMTVGINCQEQVALSHTQASPVPAPCALLPLDKVHVLYPPGSVHHAGSYYLSPGQMSVEDQMYPFPGSNPTTQKQR